MGRFPLWLVWGLEQTVLADLAAFLGPFQQTGLAPFLSNIFRSWHSGHALQVSMHGGISTIFTTLGLLMCSLIPSMLGCPHPHFTQLPLHTCTVRNLSSLAVLSHEVSTSNLLSAHTSVIPCTLILTYLHTASNIPFCTCHVTCNSPPAW